MTRCLSGLRIAVLAAAAALAAPAAHAFTFEDKATGKNGMPKFDIEEQSSNFRKDGDLDTSAIGKSAVRNAVWQRCSSACSGKPSDVRLAVRPTLGPGSRRSTAGRTSTARRRAADLDWNTNGVR